MRLLFAFLLVLLPLTAAAKNPLKPGDDVVQFRSYASDGTVQNVPPKGTEGTCWRVLAVSNRSVTVALVSGIYKPHWEDKSYVSFLDKYVYKGQNGNADFPTDMKKRHFSVFKPIDVCPATDVPKFEMKPSAYFILYQNYDSEKDRFTLGANKGEEAGCFQAVSFSDEGILVKHVSGIVKYWWNDGAETKPGGSDTWFTSDAYKENHPKADNLEMLTQIIRVVPNCP